MNNGPDVVVYHNQDGPAIVYSSTNEWWYNGERYTFQQWCEFAQISDTDRARLLAIYGGDK